MIIWFWLGIKNAVELAQKDIKRNGTILPDIDLVVINNNDGCHLDTVMRTFINYYVQNDGVLGVLGPPCSETVEPVASKSFIYFIFRHRYIWDMIAPWFWSNSVINHTKKIWLIQILMTLNRVWTYILPCVSILFNDLESHFKFEAVTDVHNFDGVEM